MTSETTIFRLMNPANHEIFRCQYLVEVQDKFNKIPSNTFFGRPGTKTFISTTCGTFLLSDTTGSGSHALTHLGRSYFRILPHEWVVQGKVGINFRLAAIKQWLFGWRETKTNSKTGVDRRFLSNMYNTIHTHFRSRQLTVGFVKLKSPRKWKLSGLPVLPDRWRYCIWGQKLAHPRRVSSNLTRSMRESDCWRSTVRRWFSSTYISQVLPCGTSERTTCKLKSVRWTMNENLPCNVNIEISLKGLCS